MLLDSCFIVELFLQHEEGLDSKWPFYGDLNTLVADLLKIGNQMPFSVLEDLYRWFCKHGNQVTDLKMMALNFCNHALVGPSDMSYPDRLQQQPKHLLDLFRSSLLFPSTPYKSNCKGFPSSIQRAQLLCKAGISLRRKRKAKSLLAIDFRKLRIPPFSLRIPPIPIDDLTSAILVHCVTLEQCLINTCKHFTAYILFMNCLMRQPEDVEFLRVANIITGIHPLNS
ncbi:hypothetical protein COLO4_15316 [Corchorus olitorius]|uniref:Uncharacterized protein n=1 Tax=Corchorus olitorius TaxID=93759 RepID=A0A1R3JNR0_9ROSI|nr:hypothetical protein COLO4_15316 [Corchorus olitorius]